MTVLETMLNRNEFSCLSEKQKSILLKFCSEIKGKNPTETVMLFIKYIHLLENEKKLSPVEKTALTEAVLSSMNIEERKNAENIINLIKNIV